MKAATIVIVLTVGVIAANVVGHGTVEDWRGIQPLQSTRIEVERIFGKPNRAGSTSLYETATELVEVRYSTGPCKGAVLGWNVPADTVLELRVSPKKPETVTIDPSRFAAAVGHVGDPYHVNVQDGLAYKLLPNGDTYSVVYFPSKPQNRLRCLGFPDYDAGLTQYRAFDSFRAIALADEQARLDNFAFTLENDPSSIAHIIVYAGRRSGANEARTQGERIKNYLIHKRRIDRRRIHTVDGGYRETLETELFVVPPDFPAPTPSPTLSKSDVGILKPPMKKGRR